VAAFAAGDLVDFVEEDDAGFSTRSMAVRVTCSMSISDCSSSWIRYSKASLTFIFRFLVRWPKMLGSMSLMLTSISSTPWLEMISKDGKLRSRVDFHGAVVEFAFAELLAELFAGAAGGFGESGAGVDDDST
jgi:hypothetical protein